MKLVKSGLITALVLASASVLADSSPPSATPAPAATPPAPAAPCPSAQPNCPMAGQPMGPGNMRNGMGQRMGSGMGPGYGMHQGMMGQGNRPGQQNPPPRKSKKTPPASGQDVIYGSQLMTPQERAAYREKIRNAKSAEERARIRAEHHKEMQERAKKMGKTLPPAPPPA